MRNMNFEYNDLHYVWGLNAKTLFVKCPICKCLLRTKHPQRSQYDITKETVKLSCNCTPQQ